MPETRFPLSALLDQAETAHEIVGDADRPVAGVRAIDAAGPEHLTFAKAKRYGLLADTRAGAVVTDAAIEDLRALDNFDQIAWVLTASPRLLISELATAFLPPRSTEVHPTAVIDPSATLAADVGVGPLASIGEDVEIGAGSNIGAGVHIYRGVRIGEGVNVGAGTVIGSDGFGYERTDEGWVKLPHLGTVIIGDRVEIGANTAIDRGTFSDTIIEEGAKVDNLVHIAHNVRVGANAMVIANAMVGGSTSIGAFTWIAPSTSLMNGIKIGENAMTGLGAVVLKDVPDGVTVIGVPAKPLERK